MLILNYNAGASMKKQVIKNFCESRNEKMLSVKEMKNGTDSNVFLVNEKYIFKFHNENAIKSEFKFFNLYKSELNEEIIFVDKHYKFIVYKFINNGDKLFNFKELILKVKKYVDDYSDFAGDGFGFLFEENNSWREFLEFELNDKKDYALKVLVEKDYQKVCQAVDVIDKYEFKKKLMHGDFGLHNLLFLNGELVGIIDPQPLIGDALYDFIFCVLSDENVAKPEIISNIYNYVSNEPKEKVDAMILFVLFGRIARCVKYNLEELNYFVELWNKINN